MDFRNNARFAATGGLQQGIGVPRRHRKLGRGDAIRGITKPAIRRIARRGGVKRIQMTIYDDIKMVIKKRLSEILEKITLVLQTTGPQGGTPRKTVTTEDVVFVLKQYMGSPIYGFDPVTYGTRAAVVKSRHFK